MKRQLLWILAIAVAACIGAISAASASAAPVIGFTLHHGPTNFTPSEEGELWLTFSQLGSEPTSGPITARIELPPGLTRSAVLADEWDCPGVPGDSSIVCTGEHLLSPADEIFTVLVNVDPTAVGRTVDVAATVEGGGAPKAAHDVEPIEINSAPNAFGIVPGSFKSDFYEEEGLTPVRQAGSHPALATFAFDLNNALEPNPEVATRKAPVESLRDVEVELPPGFVGNPSAVSECRPDQLVSETCPPSSSVGYIEPAVETIADKTANTFFQIPRIPVYNMAHPRGSVTLLAFDYVENVITIRASLDPANHYAIKTEVPQINQFLPLYFQKLTLWGIPTSARHDTERCARFFETFCPVEGQPKPFMTVPSQCNVADKMLLRRYDSWQQPGLFGPEVSYAMPGSFEECDKQPFDPSLSVHPTGQEADSPAGLEVSLKVPQNENPNAVATPPVKSVTVTLPQGMTLSPSFANGLVGCSEEQFGVSAAGVPNSDAVACPDNSRIGTVGLQTPLLRRELEGSLYLARQGENPFQSTFAVYLALHDTEERGVLLKIPGRLSLDPSTGQITTVFDELPQFPFERFTLAFRSGQRAPLINPPSCGTQLISAQIASYAQPGNAVDASGTYKVIEGSKGAPCPAGLGSAPFSPTMSAGTVNPDAGKYSPFVFRLTREDQEQEISRITATLPPGELAKISGVSECSDAAIASVSEALGSGQSELEHPSCPSSSRLGVAITGVGAGSEPKFFEGNVYLAGPYKGDPLSLAIVVPALAGPYDFGNVVVRAGIHVDPTSAQVKVESDPLPTIVHGVLLRVRDVRVNVDRQESTINPTNCNPLAVTSDILSAFGTAAHPSNRFQIANCSLLGFSPKLSIELSGATGRSKNPALKAVLTQPPGQANIAGVSVVLPKTEFIDNRHINNPCTRVQFAANACPSRSVLGYAKAYSPLLEEPLEGPVYFRSNGGERQLPDLVAALHGKFDINLVGFIDSVHQKGTEDSRLRTRFQSVPDAPVSRFVLEMNGGTKGLLQNSANLCKSKGSAQVKMIGQNGKPHDFSTVIGNSCGKKVGKNKKRR